MFMVLIINVRSLFEKYEDSGDEEPEALSQQDQENFADFWPKSLCLFLRGEYDQDPQLELASGARIVPSDQRRNNSRFILAGRVQGHLVSQQYLSTVTKLNLNFHVIIIVFSSQALKLHLKLWQREQRSKESEPSK